MAMSCQVERCIPAKRGGDRRWIGASLMDSWTISDGLLLVPGFLQRMLASVDLNILQKAFLIVLRIHIQGHLKQIK